VWVGEASASPIWGDLPSLKRSRLREARASAGIGRSCRQAEVALPHETEGLLRSERWTRSSNPKFVLTLLFQISRLALSRFDHLLIGPVAYDEIPLTLPLSPLGRGEG
jgi:hypothetical protein